jgi:hypothetical protein
VYLRKDVNAIGYFTVKIVFAVLVYSIFTCVLHQLKRISVCSWSKNKCLFVYFRMKSFTMHYGRKGCRMKMWLRCKLMM